MFNWLKNLLHKEQTSKKEKIISGGIFFIYIFATGFGGNMMQGKTMEFYNSLMKPSLTPPNWVFPIVWTILFFLIGLSAYLVWNYFKSDMMRKIFTFLYFANGILIYLWPRMFFVNQSLSGGLYVIIGIIIVAELMILTAFRTNQKAAFMLLPYLLWVLFATYLNTSIIALNV